VFKINLGDDTEVNVFISGIATFV